MRALIGALLCAIVILADTVTGQGVNKVETRYSFYSQAKAGAAPLLHDQTMFSVSATIVGGRITGDVTGNGAGNLIFSICSDGTVCGVGNVYLSCGIACNLVEGTTAPCTIIKSGVAPGTTLSWVETTTCSVQDPGVNVHARFTIP